MTKQANCVLFFRYICYGYIRFESYVLLFCQSIYFLEVTLFAKASSFGTVFQNILCYPWRKSQVKKSNRVCRIRIERSEYYFSFFILVFLELTSFCCSFSFSDAMKMAYSSSNFWLSSIFATSLGRYKPWSCTDQNNQSGKNYDTLPFCTWKVEKVFPHITWDILTLDKDTGDSNRQHIFQNKR